MAVLFPPKINCDPKIGICGSDIDEPTILIWFHA
jgi:hypothetical protein